MTFILGVILGSAGTLAALVGIGIYLYRRLLRG